MYIWLIVALTNLRSTCEFSRKSRSLSELARWKATELREFLLYTGPIVLKNVLPKRLFEHFLLFHVAVKLLVAQHFCQEFNDYAKQLIIRDGG